MIARDRRALVLGGAAILGAMLLLRAGPWAWHAFAQSRETLQGRAGRLEWMREQLAGARRMEDSAAVIRARMVALAPSLLFGSSSAEAAADLGSRLTVGAERARVRVTRTDVLDDSTAAGAARRVSLHAALESDTRGLLTLLRALSGGPGAVVVDHIQVAAEPGIEAERLEVLHTEVTVRGWYLPAARRQ